MAADPRLIEFARRMRREPTPAEEAMWRMLRNRQLAGYKFRRQHPVGLYIADFYSAAAGLVLELDGDSHTTEEGMEHDRIRHAYLQSLGLAVVRFWNFEVKENPDAILERVGELCEQRRGLRRRRTPRDHRRKRLTGNSSAG
jgi:ATP-dependent helicase HrpA/adenine-specific DNA-methyltransferase